VRAQRRRRRQRGVVSGALLAGAIGTIVVVLAIAGGGSTGRAPTVVVTQPPVSYESLPPRYSPAMAYDAARGDVVLFGGVETDRAFGDTWLWDGHGWARAHPAVSPPARAGAVMTYDPRSHTVLLFGGSAQRPHQTTLARDDMWSWNGTTWKRVVSAHEPPWGPGLAMSYDPASKSIILLTLPSSHPKLDVVPDGVGSRGVTRFGTWRWDGTDWQELSTPTAPVFANGAVFHTNPRLTPLPGGRGLLFYSWATYTGTCPPPGNCAGPSDPTGTRKSQTWTWDGRQWAEQHPAVAPTAARLVATVDGSPTAFTSIMRWTWTGSDWHSARPAGGPFDGFAVDDAHDHDVVAYDGDRTYTWDGVWRLREGTPPTSDSSPATSATTTTTLPVTSTIAPVRTCASSQLRLTFDKDLGSLMQQPGAYFTFTNGSAVQCTLDGHPTLTLFDAAGRPIGATMRRGSSYQINDPGAHVVEVAPGATVYFGFGWADVNQETGGTTQGCVSVASVSVVPPGSTDALDAAAPFGEVFCPPSGFVTAIAPKAAFTPSSP
jgi:hypothetical protein